MVQNSMIFTKYIILCFDSPFVIFHQQCYTIRRFFLELNHIETFRQSQAEKSAILTTELITLYRSVSAAIYGSDSEGLGGRKSIGPSKHPCTWKKSSID